MTMSTKLNWKDNASGSNAHAARDVGDKFVIQRQGGPREARASYDSIKPFYYVVRLVVQKNGNERWRGYAMTLPEAKALAERVHRLAWEAAKPHVLAARRAADEALKKTPRESADFQALMQQEV